jgi:hypothetical protein
MTTIFARQGDLIINRLDKPITGDLTETKRITFAGDSSGHPHTLLGDAMQRREGRRTFVRLAHEGTIEHGRAGGHQPVTLPAGDYEIGPLRERGDAGDRAVED